MIRSFVLAGEFETFPAKVKLLELLREQLLPPMSASLVFAGCPIFGI